MRQPTDGTLEAQLRRGRVSFGRRSSCLRLAESCCRCVSPRAPHDDAVAVIRAPGALHAVNLSGGWATMTIRSRIVTRSSDATGERSVGAIVVPASR
jgi:hypothetical protein